MSAERTGKPFDPYHKWLGIPPNEQPPDHYRLLGIAKFEDDADVIETAADRQMMVVRTFQTGEHSELSQKLLSKIAAAKVCLLNPEKKAAYDRRLRAKDDATKGGSGDLPRAVAAPITVSEPPTHARVRPRRLDLPVVGGIAAGVFFVGLILVLALTGGDRDDAGSVAARPGSAEQAAPANVEEPGKAPPTPNKPPRSEPPPTSPKEPSEPAIEGPPRPESSEVPSPEPADTGRPSDTSDTPKPSDAQPDADPGDPPPEPAPEEPDNANDGHSDQGLPVPTEDEQKDAEKRIRELLSEDFQRAQTPAGLSTLAKRLLQLGEGTREAADQYVLLRLARELAVEAGDMVTAFAAAERAAERFAIDPYELKGEALARSAESFSPGPDTIAQSRELAKLALTLARESIRANRPQAARVSGEIVLDIGRELRDPTFTTLGRARLEEAEELAAVWEETQAALDKLPDDSDRAEANLLLGTFHCFVREDTQTGLPLLAKSSDSALRDLAARDLGGPTDPHEQLQLARDWDDLSQTREGHGRRGMLYCAYRWYERAAWGLSGLEKPRVEKRLREIHVQRVQHDRVGLLRRFDDHDAYVMSVAFSPDGLWAASSGTDGQPSVIVSSTETGRVFARLVGHSERIHGIAYHPDGRRLVSCAADATIRVWDLQSGRESRQITGQSGTIRRVVFSKDGKYLLSVGYNSGDVRLWEFETGKLLKTFPQSGAWGGAFAENLGRVLTSGKSGPVRIWDVATGQEIARAPGHGGEVRCVVVSPDGKWAASEGEGRVIRVWSVKTGRLHDRLAGHTADIFDIDFTSDSRRLVSCALNGELRVWDLNDGSELLRLDGMGRVRVAVSPDGRRCLSEGEETVYLIGLPE